MSFEPPPPGEQPDVPEIALTVIRPEDEKKASTSAEGVPNKKEPWHLLSIPDLADALGTSLDKKDPKKSHGLTRDEAKKRLSLYGPNALSTPPGTPEFIKWLHHMADPLMLLLQLASVLSIIVYGTDTSVKANLYTFIILEVVIFGSSTFAYFQERSSNKAMEVFKNMIPLQCRVLRGGVEQTIPAVDLVPGDVVYIRTGDQTPADVRLIWVQGMKLELSSLTGESDLMPRTVDSTEEEAMEASNLAFYTSLVFDGEGYGVVYATGDRTVIGGIAQMTVDTDTVSNTTLQLEIRRLVKVIAILSAVMAIVFFIIGVARGYDVGDVFIQVFITVIVANVPQGLPPTVMSGLAICARKLSSKNVFVRQLQCVETLGSASVICSDKTGTLTQNRMSVTNVFLDGGQMDALSFVRVANANSVRAGVNIETDDALLANSGEKLKLISTVCNKARYRDGSDGGAGQAAKRVSSRFIEPAVADMVRQRSDGLMTKMGQKPRDAVIVGDASEIALLRFAELLTNTSEMRRTWTPLFEVPFNSKWKYSLSIVTRNWSAVEEAAINPDEPFPQPLYVLMKGAPEVVLSRCSKHYHGSRLYDIDEDYKTDFQRIYETFAGAGERVLGYAFKPLDPTVYTLSKIRSLSMENDNYPCNDLNFVGLTSLSDPPKQGVLEAVLTCKEAGIKVVMVTGDHPLTAASIARKVGIMGHVPTREELAEERKCAPEQVPESEVLSVVVKGSDLKHFTEEDWARVLVKEEIVFARTSPAQKLEIVERFQKQGEVVAVTGDGVNDAPALKKANIGVAMGISGSDVAKEAADVIIMDDNFASIVEGIKEGRVLFDNLTKTVAYTLSHLWPEVLPTLIAVAGGMPLFLSALLVLAIDLGTELGPAISLIYESAEADVMRRPPRSMQNDRLMTPRLMMYCYVQIGMIETFLCCLAAFVTFDYYGIPPSTVFTTDGRYFVEDADPLVVNGRHFSDHEQAVILERVQAAYFMVLVTCQFWHIWACRTRQLSLFSHPFTNTVMLYGVAIELLLMLVIIHTPGIDIVFSTDSLYGHLWWFALGGGLLIIPYTEFLKWSVRKDPQGFVARWLIY